MLDYICGKALSNCADVLYNDFDPDSCTSYFLLKEILSKNDAERISKAKKINERLEIFIAAYRENASDLKPLITFFCEHSYQSHLGDALQSCVDDASVLSSDSSLLLQKMNNGHVPSVLDYNIPRDDLISDLQSKLMKLFEGDNNWLILNGVRGCGKSRLLAEVLRRNLDFLNNHINNIFWLNDSCEYASKSNSVYIKLLILLTDSFWMQSNYQENNETYLREKIIEEIKLRPGKTLLIIDDIILEQNLRWFASIVRAVPHLLKIIAVSTNMEIFQALEDRSTAIDFNFSNTPGFTIQQISTFFSHMNLSNFTAESILENTKGLPAILGILKFQSNSNSERLLHLSETLALENDLSLFSAITPYGFRNCNTAFDKDFAVMEENDKESICNLCVVFRPNLWYNIGYATPVVSFDVASKFYDATSLGLMVLVKLHNLSLLCLSDNKFKIHPIVHKYCNGRQCGLLQINYTQIRELFFNYLNDKNKNNKVLTNSKEINSIRQDLKQYHENIVMPPIEKPINLLSYFLNLFRY
uniref:NB-ARC domain-containing protein n=1 Tax=Rhabditophanes sp. KR3021 TaxID=114890 RepID=A0AC35UAH0_9BILA